MNFTYSDLQSVWPGIGNIHADPLFINLTQLDCRLASGSPARGTGYLVAIWARTFRLERPWHPAIRRFIRHFGRWYCEIALWMDEGKPYHTEWADFFNGPWTR